MKTTNRKRPAAESIARAAERGEDVMHYFSGKGRMMPALPRPEIQLVNVDFMAGMLDELDAEARRLNVSRQAIIKTMLSGVLDQRRVRSGNGRKRAL